MGNIAEAQGNSLATLILQWDSLSNRLPVEQIPVAALRASRSPRLGGVNAEHARLLAQVATELPPILVHRPTMQVVDGMHRVTAARARGADTIAARLFDGEVDDLFAMAVRANVAHGMALTLAERKSAVLGLLASHPDWSDRLIAAATGLSNKTVGAIRRTATEEKSQLLPRVGRDGRRHPVSSAEARTAAAELFRNDPEASVASVAVASGLSEGTVRDVRARVRRGEDPAPGRRERGGEARLARRRVVATKSSRRNGSDSPAAAFERLRRDPALRFSENGRVLLRSLSAPMAAARDFEALIESIPPHSVLLVAKLARQNAWEWSALAERLDQDPGLVDVLHVLAEPEPLDDRNTKAG
ncbi:ParB N-terminal domain-containing protein [Nocardia sp. CDC153]|uniref:ParB/RepB/Spo0J family partition protein n=1 Tax=Nocardia sp. CDC153 TaxID=3112167 RepID=UPI002DBB0052|nr:ParB N-terminal domain-containing protein [Nocardia sp. CDC153]MEC3956851.1 ParB N-terminal domain-containing protein [Nocardia sp. CDC153]